MAPRNLHMSDAVLLDLALCHKDSTCRGAGNEEALSGSLWHVDGMAARRGASMRLRHRLLWNARFL